MKVLPGLPILPKGYWWEVKPSTIQDAYLVSLMTGPREFMHLPETVSWDLTRSWPRPTARSVIRTAHKIHQRWSAQQAQHDAPFVGKLTGTPS